MDARDPKDAKNEVYPFHKANIHECRLAARLCRALPLIIFVATAALLIVGVAVNRVYMLAVCAVLNTAMFLWMLSTSVIGIVGFDYVATELGELAKRKDEKTESATPEKVPETPEGAVHVIVLPNYKEDEGVLGDTLLALREAKNSSRFHVVLAMEAREEGAEAKAQSLFGQFSGSFATLTVTRHPNDLKQGHEDDSQDDEVPGKASNLKYAVQKTYDVLSEDPSIDMANVLLTIADADCLFHPSYFEHVAQDFQRLRAPVEKDGTRALEWVLWQAPQLAFRDHWRAPVVSRVWSYISATYEAGGTCGLRWGGHHMLFSSYSMPLRLATAVQCWDGDIIAEDHHAYLKTFFYSLYESARELKQKESKRELRYETDYSMSCPTLQVRPVLLPVKSTPIISSDGYWQNWVDRWHQATRHCQGVAEYSYALLATYDMWCTTDWASWTWQMLWKLTRIHVRLFCMHVLPIVQSISLATITLYWLGHGQRVPFCPADLGVSDILSSDYMLCGLAGAWVLVWPVVLPFCGIILANFRFIQVGFLNPVAEGSPSGIWAEEDGGFPEWCSSRDLSALLIVVLDCAIFVSPLMVVYGFVAMLTAYVSICYKGNRTTYITASKPTKEKLANYGTLPSAS